MLSPGIVSVCALHVTVCVPQNCRIERRIPPLSSRCLCRTYRSPSTAMSLPPARSALGALLWLLPVASALQCPAPWHGHKGKCYAATPAPATFEGCLSSCGDNATLATIDSKGLEAFLGERVVVPGYWWIGLHETGGAGRTWAWASASASNATYRNWAWGEPNNYNGVREKCAIVIRGEAPALQWYDAPCTAALRCVCEWPGVASAGVKAALPWLRTPEAAGEQPRGTPARATPWGWGIAWYGLLFVVFAVNWWFLLPALTARRSRAAPVPVPDDPEPPVHVSLESPLHVSPAPGLGSACATGAEPPAAAAGAGDRVDTAALTGLRGFAALHIAVGHYGLFAGWLQVGLFGGWSLSLFYLLSGFVLTLGYARAQTDRAHDPPPPFAAAAFLRKRFARVFPLYLITNLLGLPLLDWQRTPAGTLVLQIGLTVCGLNMWVYPFAPTPMPVNGLTWTVQTMAAFYLVFPFLLRWLRGIRRRTAVGGALLLVQGLAYGALAAAGAALATSTEFGYWTARAWPFSRIPVFVLGCLMAVERMHPADGGSRIGPRGWGVHADLAMLLYVLAVAGCVLAHVRTQRHHFYAFRLVGEPLCPVLFVPIVYGLSRCGEQSVIATVFRWRAMQVSDVHKKRPNFSVGMEGRGLGDLSVTDAE